MPEHEGSPLLHEWLRETTGRIPAATAIREDGRNTSFGELFRYSAALASTFIRRGLGKGDRVAIVAPKSTDSITVLFATLMSGGVYVPLQPRWPADRLDRTLKDCSPRFVYRETACGPQLTDTNDGASIPWGEALAGSISAAGLPDVSPGDPAFILFTSGSTGQPKGAVISHQAVAAFVTWCGEEFGIHERDRIACPSPLGFDLSTFDVFSMARAGAVCVIVPEQITWMPRFLTRFVAEAAITAWYSVPTILAAMLNEGHLAGSQCPDLRLVLFAGEALSSRNVGRLLSAVPQAACYNMYGPTETNVVTYYRVPEGFDPSHAVPIGVPCPYAELAFDPAGIEEAAGVRTGELLVGGNALMTGYWNRLQETERAFTNLLPGGPRFYRTGDRVWVDECGCYTFVGRLDRQVKRRGHRIELGEVEAALSRHPGVLEAAAIAFPDDQRGTVITAFIRATPGAVLSDVQIRKHCAAVLPAYMMPDRIVSIDVMPKGGRGKVDYLVLENLYVRT